MTKAKGGGQVPKGGCEIAGRQKEIRTSIFSDGDILKKIVEREKKGLIRGAGTVGGEPWG